jgi:hypothetical protein
LITWPIADLDLGDLSLWLAVLKAAPVAAASLGAAIGAVLQTELVLNIEYFIHCDQPVVVVELVDCRKVLVLLFFDWYVRIGFFDREFGAISLKYTLNTQTRICDLSCLIMSFLFLFNRLLLHVYDAS